MQLKKSYMGFVIWMVAYIASCFLLTLIPMDEELSTMIVMNQTTLLVFILSLIIYFSEKIFWYSGVSYEQALEAGSVRRKQYAKKHLVRFGILEIVNILYSLIAFFLHFNFYVSVVVVCAGLVVIAFSTKNIKL